MWKIKPMPGCRLLRVSKLFLDAAFFKYCNHMKLHTILGGGAVKQSIAASIAGK